MGDATNEIWSPGGSPRLEEPRTDSQEWARRLGSALVSTFALLQPISSQAAPAPLQPFIAQAVKGNLIIYPTVILPYPYPIPQQEKVRVRFVAEGQEWGAVYLDDRLLYRPSNFNRQQEFLLEEGAYHLRVTGVVSFDVWDSGYLDVGRGDSGALQVIFSKTGGIRVIGDPYAWLPDAP